MNKNGVFDRLKGLFVDLMGKNRFGREDFVLLKTVMMLAAVDGEVGAEEVGRPTFVSRSTEVGEGVGRLVDARADARAEDRAAADHDADGHSREERRDLARGKAHQLPAHSLPPDRFIVHFASFRFGAMSRFENDT